jgi:formylglycine-generating enzyme required for sulfatase activity
VAARYWIDRYESAVHHGGTGAQLGTATTTGGGADDVGMRLPRNGQRVPGTTDAPLLALTHEGMPTVNVTWFQANEACRAAGKRLPAGDEWLAAASGTQDNSTCNTSSGGARAASASGACRSAWGAHDMIGGVWEWTAEWYAGLGDVTRSTPDAMNSDGWGADYNSDGTWNITSSAYHDGNGSRRRFGVPSAAIRGGSGLDGARAGVFALPLEHSPSNWGSHVGFRCVVPR